jgi:hypothetical protein
LYYLLLAIGPLNGNLMSQHRTKASTDNPYNLTITGVNAGAAEDTTGFKIHGCLMALAWLACAPTGMLLARYYRKTWVRNSVFLGTLKQKFIIWSART